MVIVKLMGGLGNQMFQYAVGRHLTHKYGSSLKLMLCMHEHEIKRDYMLDAYNIDVEFVQPSDFINCRIYKEKDRHFDRNLLSMAGDVVLEGYFQSEKYFSDIQDIIRKDFALKASFKGSHFVSLQEQIKSCNSVSLHVRRGDYVMHPPANAVLGPRSIDYYKEAAKKVLKSIPNAHFFLFSDDIPWVRKHINFVKPSTVVDTGTPQESLQLMSFCKHHIIANSTFSWWAAWLNKKTDKIVYAPSQWFRCEDLNNQNRDMIPETWNTI